LFSEGAGGTIGNTLLPIWHPIELLKKYFQENKEEEQVAP